MPSLYSHFEQNIYLKVGKENPVPNAMYPDGHSVSLRYVESVYDQCSQSLEDTEPKQLEDMSNFSSMIPHITLILLCKRNRT